MSTLPRLFDIFSPSRSTTQPWCIQWFGEVAPERDRLGALVLVVRELEVLPAAVEVEPLAEQVERSSRRTRCASRVARRPTVTATTARPASTASTARSRRDAACPPRRTPRARRRRRSSPRCPGAAAGRSRAPTTRRGTRRRRSGTPRRARRAGRSSRPSRRRTRSRAGRRSAWRRRARPSTRTTGRSYCSVISVHGRPSRCALLMMLSSMSVMLLTSRTRRPGPLEVAAQHVVDDRRPAVTEVRRAVDGRATQVDAHGAGVAETELADLPARGVVQVQHGRSLRAARRAAPGP